MINAAWHLLEKRRTICRRIRLMFLLHASFCLLSCRQKQFVNRRHHRLILSIFTLNSQSWAIIEARLCQGHNAPALRLALSGHARLSDGRAARWSGGGTSQRTRSRSCLAAVAPGHDVEAATVCQCEHVEYFRVSERKSEGEKEKEKESEEKSEGEKGRGGIST